MKRKLFLLVAMICILSLGAFTACDLTNESSSSSTSTESNNSSDVAGESSDDSSSTCTHVYDNACDADCNECGDTRTPADHVYDNACDADCNVCDAERTPADHVYDNACDADCNECGDTRTPADHVYDNEGDRNCNVCDEERELNKYTVTFDVDGGSAVEAQMVEYGTPASALANFTSEKAGYTFAGWTLQDGTAIPEGAIVTGDITVKAAWTINTYMVTFNAGNDVSYAVEVTYGETVKVPAEVIPEGYKYAVWKDANGYYDLTKAVVGELTLTASEWYKGISTAAEFMAMEADKNYVLENDIDFADIAVFNSTYVISTFNGILEGNGYAVKNVQLQSGDPGKWTAIFGTLNGTVRHISFENIQLKGWGDKMCGESGLIAQKVTGTISNVYLSGSIQGVAGANMGFADYSSWGYQAGMVAACAEGATINNIVVDVTLDTPNNSVQYVVGKGAYTLTGGIFLVRTDNGNDVGGSYNWQGVWIGVDSLAGLAANMDEILGNSYYANINDAVWEWDTTDGDVVPEMKKNSYINTSMMEFLETEYGVKVYAKVNGEYVDVTADYVDKIGECKAEYGTIVDISSAVTAIVPEGYVLDNASVLAGRNYGDLELSVYVKSAAVTVTFKKNVDDAGVQVQVEPGSTVTVPETAIPEGYDYAVWKNGDSVYDFGVVTEDITLVAEVFYIGVSTAAEFMAMEADKNYVLENDIDFADIAVFNSTYVISTFNGILEGNGYAVKNVQLQSGDPGKWTAIFGTLNGTVRHISFENIQLKGWGDKMCGESGLIAQKVTGTISNVYLSGSIQGVAGANMGFADYSSWGYQAGMVAACAEGATINNIVVDVTLDTPNNSVQYVVGKGTYTLTGGIFLVGTANGNDLGGSYNWQGVWVGITTVAEMAPTMDEILGNPYYANGNDGAWVWDTTDGGVVPQLIEGKFVKTK